jgi:hypothetical protein
MWERHKVARVENLANFGGLHVTGWDHARHCGCRVSVGMRMDKHELTTVVNSCPEHEVYVARAFDTLKNMPPQDEPIMDLFERLLEAELRPTP